MNLTLNISSCGSAWQVASWQVALWNSVTACPWRQPSCAFQACQILLAWHAVCPAQLCPYSLRKQHSLGDATHPRLQVLSPEFWPASPGQTWHQRRTLQICNGTAQACAHYFPAKRANMSEISHRAMISGAGDACPEAPVQTSCGGSGGVSQTCVGKNSTPATLTRTQIKFATTHSR